MLTLEEKMDRASFGPYQYAKLLFLEPISLTDDEPQQRSFVAASKRWLESVEKGQGDAELDSTSCEEKA